MRNNNSSKRLGSIARVGVAGGLCLAALGADARVAESLVMAGGGVAGDPAAISAASTQRPKEKVRPISVAMTCTERILLEDGGKVRVLEESCQYQSTAQLPYPAGDSRIKITWKNDREPWTRFVSVGADGVQRSGRCTLSGFCVFSASFVGTGAFEGQRFTEDGGTYAELGSDPVVLEGAIRLTRT